MGFEPQEVAGGGLGGHFQGGLGTEEAKGLGWEESGRRGSHTWDHLLLAKFYNQRVPGQGSVNNASVHQAALWGESSGTRT